jgi:hypothetical protein
MYCRWRSSYQAGRAGDPVIKQGGLGSSYQAGRVGIQLSSREGWDPINRFNLATFLYISQARTLIPNIIFPVFLCVQLRREDRFVDISGIDYHHCLNFLFINAGVS